MDGFISVCSNGKQELHLGDFREFSVKELSGIMWHYNENKSGKKANLLMGIFGIFYFLQSKLHSQQLFEYSFMDPTTCCTY